MLLRSSEMVGLGRRSRQRDIAVGFMNETTDGTPGALERKMTNVSPS